MDSMYEAILCVKFIIWINTEERIKGKKTSIGHWMTDGICSLLPQLYYVSCINIIIALRK